MKTDELIQEHVAEDAIRSPKSIGKNVDSSNIQASYDERQRFRSDNPECELYGFKMEELDGGDYLVHTDKYFDDGDELHIVLKTDGEMMLSDEGHTIMWLTYDNFYLTHARERILNRIFGQNNVSFEDGRITVSVKTVDDFGSSLASMVQAISQVADMRHHQHDIG